MHYLFIKSLYRAVKKRKARKFIWKKWKYVFRIALLREGIYILFSSFFEYKKIEKESYQEHIFVP